MKFEEWYGIQSLGLNNLGLNNLFWVIIFVLLHCELLCPSKDRAGKWGVNTGCVCLNLISEIDSELATAPKHCGDWIRGNPLHKSSKCCLCSFQATEGVTHRQ